jgi:hypothetical protein
MGAARSTARGGTLGRKLIAHLLSAEWVQAASGTGHELQREPKPASDAEAANPRGTDGEPVQRRLQGPSVVDGC